MRYTVTTMLPFNQITHDFSLYGKPIIITLTVNFHYRIYSLAAPLLRIGSFSITRNKKNQNTVHVLDNTIRCGFVAIKLSTL